MTERTVPTRRHLPGQTQQSPKTHHNFLSDRSTVPWAAETMMLSFKQTQGSSVRETEHAVEQHRLLPEKYADLV
ncbi:TPA: hypothetical protein ACK11E_004154 [Citrobacter pasteurii]|uniref:hypothetical protein n=1 Tax=Citrobacter sp. Cu233 TaxID=2985160 RepID=UPI002577CE95|nr:hypothetical protein [Citrobacter sp. Cu233]MDM2935221.1 hypothetical protein [Citrobacter sp. Cu233]